MEIISTVDLMKSNGEGFNIKILKSLSTSGSKITSSQLYMAHIDYVRNNDITSLGEDLMSVVLDRLISAFSKNLAEEPEGNYAQRPTFWAITLSGQYNTLLLSPTSENGDCEVLVIDANGKLTFSMEVSRSIRDVWTNQLYKLKAGI